MRLRELGVVALVALPWLNPFSPLPSPAVVPWLLAAGCGVLLFLLRSWTTGPQLLAGLLLAAVLSAVIGLLQYAGSSAALGEWIASARPGEAYGNLRQRNQFAALMNIGLAATLWLSIAVADKRRTLQLGLMVCTILVVAGNAASASRTGLLQLLMLLALAWVWNLWRQPFARWLLLLCVATYVSSSLLLPDLLGAVGNEEGIWGRLHAEASACNDRTLLWRNVLQLIAARPWTGWGWGELDYAHFITLYEGPRFCEILDNAHNLPLHLAVELGLPLAVLICSPVLVLVWRARPWQELNPDREVAWAVLALVFVHSLLEYPLWYGPFQLVCLICLWLLRRPATQAARVKPLIAGKEVFIATGVLSLTAYAAWDYQRVQQIYLAPADRAAEYRDDTLEKVKDTYLFQDQVLFAEYMLAPPGPENTQRLHALGRALLHYSPEPNVVAKLIESARMLGNEGEACAYEIRFRVAYPQAFENWEKQKKTARISADCSSGPNQDQLDPDQRQGDRASNGKPVQAAL